MELFSQRGSAKWVIIFLVLIILIMIAGGIFFFTRPSSTTYQQTATPSPETGQPAMKTTDLAPGVTNDQKTAVVIKHSDSSYEKLLVPNAMVDGYIKSLPEGDIVVSQNPLLK